MPRHQGELPAIGADIHHRAAAGELAQHRGMLRTCRHLLVAQSRAPGRYRQDARQLVGLGGQVGQCDFPISAFSGTGANPTISSNSVRQRAPFSEWVRAKNAAAAIEAA